MIKVTICTERRGLEITKKPIENARKRVFDAVNPVLFSKTVSNKFITVQDIVFIILLYCNSIPEFVASR